MSERPSPTRSTLRERVERRARHRYLRLVADQHPLEDGDHDIARGKVRPLGVAPARWIAARARGLMRETFVREMTALVLDVADELYADETPDRAA